jgi:hypothetical protein
MELALWAFVSSLVICEYEVKICAELDAACVVGNKLIARVTSICRK